MDKRIWVFLLGGLGGILLLIICIPLVLSVIFRQTIDQAISPITESSQLLNTQVSGLLNPSPTVIPDPVTILHEIRSMARLETIQYTIEKVITAEIGQGTFGFLLGDKLLFVAHGYVIAGIDLENLNLSDIRIEGETVYLSLPEPEIFVATLDNEKSYVYNRETGYLTHGDQNLETTARRTAEEEIRKAAIEDGILEIAGQNAENYLSRLISAMGYKYVIFENTTPQP